MQISNEKFLSLIFGDEWGSAHVTGFKDDPANIENDRRGLCWGGGRASDRLHKFTPDMNQYFTISLFKPEEETGRAVRRKANFDGCFVIVADDVKEKLPLENVERLPVPTYKLLTSEHSEQWGWVLSEACEDAGKVNNLLDGLVAKGLAPDGTDPGMKGVTRYVRLPEGSNSKASRLIDGKPFKCQVLEWNPRKFYTLEELAEVFEIDLNAPRQETGSGLWLEAESEVVKNHPVLPYLTITGYGADGWVRVDCPNAHNHSGGDASGAAVQVQHDGTLFFQCHHGHCNGDKDGGKKLTGNKVVALLDETKCNGSGELKAAYTQYRKQIDAKLKIENAAKIAKAVKKTADFVGGVTEYGDTGKSEEAELATDETPYIFDPLRYVFIAPENRFYDTQTGLLITPSGLDNRHMATFPRARNKMMASEALLSTMDKSISEADGLSWVPTGMAKPAREDLVIDVEGRRMINTWSGFALKPVEGDVSLWLNHVDYLIPDPKEREVVLDYLACIVQRVSDKPAFFIGHRGGHRTGKDLFYKPVMQALGFRISRAVEIDNIIAGWGDYVNELKFVIVTEVDKAQDKKVANSMKTIAAPTASGYRVLNMKGKSVVTQLDCMGGVMMSNKRHFIAIEPGDKRYFIVDSWVEPKEESYYKAIDCWYKKRDGYAKVLNYLLNRDISNFNHNQLPYMTPGALEMVQAGKYDYEQDLEEMINDRLPPFHNAWVTSKEMRVLVKENGLRCGNNGLDEALRGLGWFKFRGQKRIDGALCSTQTYYTNQLPASANLKEAFEFFTENPRKAP